MNCGETQNLFSDLYDNGLSSAERETLTDHLRTCLSCGKEYKLYETGLKTLRQGEEETSRMFAGGVLAAVLRETGQKRSSRRRFPAWVIAGSIAAAVTLAFVGGVMLRPAGKESDRDRDLRRRGFVQVGGNWIPRPMLDRFRKGEVCVGGRMLPREKALEVLARGSAGRKDLEKRLAALGYGKEGRRFVPREWLEKWSKGYVQLGVDKWATRETFESNLAKDLQLVKYKGSWVPHTELGANRIVRRPAEASADNEVTRWLEGLEIGPPVTSRNVTLYPILSKRRQAESAFFSLHQAMAQRQFEVREAGSPLQVLMINRSPRPVFGLVGEILVGGRHERILNEEVWIPPGGEARVSVLCGEHGKDRAEEVFQEETGHYLAAYGIRRLALGRYGQGAVWCGIVRQIEITGGQAGSQAEIYRQLSSDLFRTRASFADLPERFPNAIGVAVAVGENLHVVELFGSPRVFETYFEEIVQAACLEGLLRWRDAHVLSVPSELPNSLAGVRQLLESPFASQWEASGKERLLLRDREIFGRAWVEGDRVIHFLAYARMPGGLPDRHAKYEVPAAKLAKVMDEMEGRIVAGELDARLSAVRELSLLHDSAATPRLLRYLNENNQRVRLAVVRRIGRRRDPSAVPALLDLLTRSRADVAVSEAALGALARIGDLRAVPRFLSGLKEDAGGAWSALRFFPELLLRIRDRSVFGGAMEELLAFFAKAERGAEGKDRTAIPWSVKESSLLSVAARNAFEMITGRAVDSAAEARAWWNRAENRKRVFER